VKIYSKRNHSKVKHPGIVLSVIAFLALSIGVTVWSFNTYKSTLSHAQTPSTTTINKKVFTLVFNPIMPDGRDLISYKGWQDASTLMLNYDSFIRNVTGSRIQYAFVGTQVFQYFPTKTDGFTYTPQTYLDVLSGKTPHHSPDYANYYQFLNDPSLDLCGRVNRGEVDEIWLFGGPWMGFYESTLASSSYARSGFKYNDSGDTHNKTSCNKLVPVMGFSYELGLSNMVHDLGHRTEATMTYLYGDNWPQTRIANNWDRFTITKYKAGSNYSHYGCGYIHFTPNASSSSDDAKFNLTNSVNSYCDDFNNYPTLGSPLLVSKSINCQVWGCNEIGYYTWWFKHIPHFVGTGSDGIQNDWWQYIIDPNKTPANQPSYKTFSGMSATLAKNLATFSFSYTGWSALYRVDLSTVANMSTDVYSSFATGYSGVISESNPTKWNKYVCGSTLYWRVVIYETGEMSPIQSAKVNCASASLQVRRSFLSLDGKVYYQQTCPYDTSAGGPVASCATGSTSKPWTTVSLSSIGAPSSAGAYTTFIFPQNGLMKLRQSFIDLSGTKNFFRTCSFDPIQSDSGSYSSSSNCGGNWNPPTQLALINTTSTFGGYTVIVYQNSHGAYRVRRSFINLSTNASLNGTTYYQQTCPFDATSGGPDTTCVKTKPWASVSLATIGAPSNAGSYTTFLFPQNGIVKIRQTLLDTTGTKNFFRTCAFDPDQDDDALAFSSKKDCSGNGVTMTPWSPLNQVAPINGNSTFGGYTVIVY